jgi:hypothetical protein
MSIGAHTWTILCAKLSTGNLAITSSCCEETSRQHCRQPAAGLSMIQHIIISDVGNIQCTVVKTFQPHMDTPSTGKKNCRWIWACSSVTRNSLTEKYTKTLIRQQWGHRKTRHRSAAGTSRHSHIHHSRVLRQLPTMLLPILVARSLIITVTWYLR